MKTSVDRRHVIRHGNRRDVVRAILHRVADADDAKCCLASSKCCLYRNSRHSSARYSVERQAMFKPDSCRKQENAVWKYFRPSYKAVQGSRNVKFAVAVKQSVELIA